MTKRAAPALLSAAEAAVPHPLFPQPPDEPGRSEWKAWSAEQIERIDVYRCPNGGGKRLFSGRHLPGDLLDEATVRSHYGGGTFIVMAMGAPPRSGQILTQRQICLEGPPKLPPDDGAASAAIVAAATGAPAGASGASLVPAILAGAAALAAAIVPAMMQAATARETRASEERVAADARLHALLTTQAQSQSAQTSALLTALTTGHAANAANAGAPTGAPLDTFLAGAAWAKDNAKKAEAENDIFAGLEQAIDKYGPAVASLFGGTLPTGVA